MFSRAHSSWNHKFHAWEMTFEHLHLLTEHLLWWWYTIVRQILWFDSWIRSVPSTNVVPDGARAVSGRHIATLQSSLPAGHERCDGYPESTSRRLHADAGISARTVPTVLIQVTENCFGWKKLFNLTGTEVEIKLPLRRFPDFSIYSLIQSWLITGRHPVDKNSLQWMDYCWWWLVH